jgi:hypothetical protein
VSNFIRIVKNPLAKNEGIFYLKSSSTFLLLILFLLSAHLKSQSKLEVKNPKINFGSVKKGEVIKNKFEITNTGKSPLILEDVEISCSCTTADFSTEPILPGQTSTVTVIFNTKTVYGRQDRIVYLISNHPKGPVKLRYKGMVLD